MADWTISGNHGHWVDTLNPWVWRICGDFGIRWYGVSYVAGILITYALFSRWSRLGVLPVTRKQVRTLLSLGVGAGILGARVGEFTLYRWHELLLTPSHFVDLRIGGMSSHGGFAFVSLALILYAKRLRIDKWILLDTGAVAGAFAIALGRLANFVNGEIWGRPSTVWWAVIFPKAPLVSGVQVPRHPSQLYAALLEGVLVGIVAGWTLRHQNRTGCAAAIACVTYSAARFIDEFWRSPDPSQPLYWGWMTRGQWLTIPMFLVGASAFIFRMSSSLTPSDISTELEEGGHTKCSLGR